MQEELFGVEFNLWMKHKETHKVGRVIENEAVVSGCLSRAKFSLHTGTLFRDLIFPLRSSHQSEQEAFCPRSLGPHFHLLSGCHPQVAARPLTCHLRNSWCCHSSGPGLLKRREKKKKKIPAS